MEEMNYLDLFSGCGGFRRGLEEAGFTFEWEGHSEIDKYAKQVYEKHYPDSEDLGDVSRIIISELPRGKYIVTAGWPCQDNSIAGKRKGQSGGLRSGLFDEVIRVLSGLIAMGSEVIFIGENVKGLYSVNDGMDFLDTIARLAFLDTGMPQLTLESQLCNTRWFLPQNRERIYFVGYSSKRSKPKIFPIEKGDESIKGVHRESRQNIKIIDDVGRVNKFKQGDRVKEDGDCFTLNTIEQRGISIPEATKKGYAVAEEGDSINLSVPDSKTRRGRVRKGEANTLDTGQQQYTIQSGIRRLTPTECERLQGFPSRWTEIGVDKDGKDVLISDTQRYRLLGNAVTVEVVKEVVCRLAKHQKTNR